MYESKRRQSLELYLRQPSPYLACAIARLIVILAPAIFRSCWGFYAYEDMRTCDRTCLRAWTDYDMYSVLLSFLLTLYSWKFFINESCVVRYVTVYSESSML